MSDYYQDLGVERSATAEEIKRAYRRLARQLHPDVNSGAEAEEQFKTVSRAYEVLSDPDKRRNYDLGVDPFAAGGGAGFSGQGFSFSDVMDAFFGGAATQRGPRSRAHRGQDALVRIQIDLHDAVFGSEEAVSYTHLRAHETVLDLVCRLLLEKKKNEKIKQKNTKKKAQSEND